MQEHLGTKVLSSDAKSLQIDYDTKVCFGLVLHWWQHFDLNGADWCHHSAFNEIHLATGIHHVYNEYGLFGKLNRVIKLDLHAFDDINIKWW